MGVEKMRSKEGETGARSSEVARFHPEFPVREVDGAIEFSGVKLDRSKRGDKSLIPDRKERENYVHDRLTVEMQRFVATAWLLGEPALIEAGSDIGKSTLARVMGGALDAEVYWINCKDGDSDEFMGKMHPRKAEDTDSPEYVFVPGNVTRALQVEEGKKKVLVLDEINAASPAKLLRIHEVLDAHQRNGTVVLTEDRSQTVQVDNTQTHIIALQNPPGNGYMDRYPLDPALIRRMLYFKGPDNLPADVSLSALASSFGLPTEIRGAPESLRPRSSPLTEQQLSQVRGLPEILNSYHHFHRYIQESVENRELAADQPQRFDFRDRTEFKRVAKFIRHFYHGDVTETMQQALEVLYVSRIESEGEKNAVRALVEKVTTKEGALRVRKPAEREQPRAAESVFVQPTVDESIPVAQPDKNQPIDIRDLTERVVRELPDLGLRPDTLFQSEKIENKKIEEGEKNAWADLLGAEVPVKPLPGYVTREMREKIHALGMELRYVPALEIPLDTLAQRSVPEFLVEMQSRYPNLRPLESLEGTDAFDATVPRNLESWFWEQVKVGNIEFPELPGQWVAVETIAKPRKGDPYERTPLPQKLKTKDQRTYSTWDQVDNSLKGKHANRLLEELCLEGKATLRLLSAPEYTLLGNRDAGWGNTPVGEWTTTALAPTPDNPGNRHLLAGGTAEGGVATFGWLNDDDKSQYVGSRAAIVFAA